MPGDPLGDVFFAFLAAKVKHRIRLAFCCEELTPCIAREVGHDPLGLISEHESLEA